MKNVEEDGSGKEDEGFVPEGIDLGLSLGQLVHPGSSSSDGGRGRRDRTLRLPQPSVLSIADNCYRDIWRDFDQIGEELVSLGTERADADRERDFLSKRPKFLAYAELYNTGTCSSGLEASGSPAVVDSTSQCSVVSNDHGCPNPRDSSDGGGVDLDTSRAREDVENKMDLTEDLLHLVFSFLGQKDLCKAGAVCKQWQVASMHEDFWRCLNFENTEISQENFDAICRRYPSATEVNIFGTHNADVLVMGAMSSLRRLETLILGKGQLNDDFFHALTNCRALKSLTICDSSLGSGLQEIAVIHDTLRELHIMKCRVLRVSVRCPQLQSLSLRRTSMAYFSLTCPQLHELDIASCHKLSDVGIRTAATSCPLLASLDMSSCSCVSDETIREIASSCPNLCVLNASYCPNITLESVSLPMVTDLKLHSCDGITLASISAISHSRMLEALQLDNCCLLASVSLDLPHLRSISLVHCRKFVELNLQSPVLLDIKVSNCSALRRISIVSKALQKLVLQKQQSLASLTLQCPNLQEVDLSDCDSLTNSVCEVFSDGGGCPTLSSLILDNCKSLTLVRLNSSSLASLSLVGCNDMSVLELSCPNLQKVNLDGCDHLERASFTPVGLESLNLGICSKLSILQIEAPLMLVLELKGCGVLSQASINCPSLMSLDASFCRQFTNDSLSKTVASCNRIESLILQSCEALGDDGLSSLHCLQHLTSLDLSYTYLTNLQPIFNSCLQLVVLKLSACKYLTNTSLDALYKEGALPALRQLDLSYLSIRQSAIAELLASCTNLVNVKLNGCTEMRDLIWSSSDYHSSKMPIDEEAFKQPDRLLEILNCVGCSNIKKVLIPSNARCFHLHKLNLNLSTNLKEVDIACFNLRSLNLSHCSSLEILKLDCPRLTNLQLQDCGMLEMEVVEAVITHCKTLEILNLHSCPKIHSGFVERLRRACPTLKRIQ